MPSTPPPARTRIFDKDLRASAAALPSQTPRGGVEGWSVWHGRGDPARRLKNGVPSKRMGENSGGLPTLPPVAPRPTEAERLFEGGEEIGEGGVEGRVGRAARSWPAR